MKTFHVESIKIAAPFETAFSYVAEARNLPQWTNAFKDVSDGQALMQTPDGSVEVELRVNASRELGTIDWIVRFPDGSVAKAYSRLVEQETEGCIYSFLLMAPPVPLERLEGTVEQQAQLLREELASLSAILADRAPALMNHSAPINQQIKEENQ